VEVVEVPADFVELSGHGEQDLTELLQALPPLVPGNLLDVLPIEIPNRQCSDELSSLFGQSGVA